MTLVPTEYGEYLEYIRDPRTRDAFRVLVTEAAASGRFVLEKAPHGYMKNITMFEGAGKPFSIVPAKDWFTFYVRTPQVTHPGLTIDQLRARFSDSAPAQGKEMKIKVRTEAESAEVLDFIGVSAAGNFRAPDELHDAPSELSEGVARQVTVNAYERNRYARMRCIAHYGAQCSVCSLSFEQMYGDIGRGYIHVHHLVSLASIGRSYVVDPIRDLRPVCANCHAMLHTSEPPLAIEELRRRLT